MKICGRKIKCRKGIKPQPLDQFISKMNGTITRNCLSCREWKSAKQKPKRLKVGSKPRLCEASIICFNRWQREILREIKEVSK